MDFFTAMGVAGSGLSAQRVRMNVASSNLANVSTTSTPEGGPYRRRDVVLEGQVLDAADLGDRAKDFAQAIQAVRVSAIISDDSEPQVEYDPGHPDADADGYVAFPNINVVEEMVDMITASRAYEAGVTVLRTAVSMAERAIGIGG